MPDEMYVVRLENDCCEDFTRTLRCCRLLNKMKGMKPTRELHIIRRPLTGARKSLTGPTPEKDNSANPEAPRINIYIHIYTHKHTHMYIYIHLHIHTYIYTHIYNQY